VYRGPSINVFAQALFVALYFLDRPSRPWDAYPGNFEDFHSWHLNLMLCDRSRSTAGSKDWFYKEVYRRTGGINLYEDLKAHHRLCGCVISPNDRRMMNRAWSDLVEEHPEYLLGQDIYGHDPSVLECSFHRWLLIRVEGLTFIGTKFGLMGLACRRVQPNDEVVLFRNMNEPVIVRRDGSGLYKFVGPVYLPGANDIVQRVEGTALREDFVLV
jgi:hypothetical protein